ncbi:MULTISPECIES: GNAT family N-acetyltransferase [Cohnella]|jgi:ribosomal protein S18 acetylase RimI-like enzyme|uniref:GNAT family N-acetyltransferase n=1 Tax=Cohnella TaxID=329857 RepID=UPI000E38E3E7|nr:GNAT family N-acetyltransferase [Cohnella sp.]REK67877.1 MAG: GNAT family N-acetyltransferase [Cohnella sp.]
MIRWKNKRDIPGIVRLVRSQLVPISPWFHPRDKRLYDIVSRRIQSGSTLVASQSRSGSPFAFVHFNIRQDRLFIDLLAVDAAFQGRRWGTELMMQAEAHGLGEGCTVAHLFVDEKNERALRFYRRLGYKVARHVKELHCFELFKPLGGD